MSTKLTFGYLYDFRNPPERPRPWTDLYAEILDVAAWSETAGFKGAWVPEHHLTPDGFQPSPLVALAAIAARTKSITLGTGIALAPLYHPVRFAQDCAVLDILSGGRLEMSLGIGYRRREYDLFGLDLKQRGSRFDEFLQIVCALWAGETVTFEGKHFSIRDAEIMPRPLRGHIPLFIGGFAAKAVERAARYDGYFGNEELYDVYVEKLRAEGRDASQARMRVQGTFYLVARDPEKAMEELGPYYHFSNNGYGAILNEDQAKSSLGWDEPPPKPMDFEQFRKSGVLQIATPEEAILRFRTMQERSQVEHFVMMMPSGVPSELFVKYAQDFADDVIPSFQRR